MALANDASMSGDRIKAESFFQYADHYYRVLMLANGGVDPRKTPVEENNTIVSKNSSENESGKDQKEEIGLVEEKDSISKEENLVTSIN